MLRTGTKRIVSASFGATTGTSFGTAFARIGAGCVNASPGDRMGSFSFVTSLFFHESEPQTTVDEGRQPTSS